MRQESKKENKVLLPISVAAIKASVENQLKVHQPYEDVLRTRGQVPTREQIIKEFFGGFRSKNFYGFE